MEPDDWGVLRLALARKIAVLEGKLTKTKNALAALDEVFRDAEPIPAVPTAPQSSRSVPGTVNGKTDLATTSRIGAAGGKKTRIDLIEELMRRQGGKLTMIEIVNGLEKIGNKRPDMSRSQFYNVIDSSMRSGRDRGRFRRTGKMAEWELSPESDGSGASSPET